MLTELKYFAAVRCLLALLLLGAGTGFSAAQSFSFPRLRLAATNGLTNRVFTAGDRVVPEATVSNGVWYRVTVRDNAGVVKNPSAACTPTTIFASTDNSYTIKPGDAPTTSGTYKFILETFSGGACNTTPINSATQQFYVVRAAAFTSPSLTAETNRFSTAQTAFVRVEGLPPFTTNWNILWILPNGSTSCVNTAGSDRPDVGMNSVLSSSYLAYPPDNVFPDPWNRATNYSNDGPACQGFSTASQGEWQVHLSRNFTNFVTLPVFLLSNDCVAVTVNPPVRASCEGTAAIFTAVTNGTGPFTLVWRKDDAVLTGVTGTVLNIPNVTVGTAGVYSVESTGPCGSATNFATLFVTTPQVPQALPPQTVCSNDTVMFIAPTNGPGPFTFQWRRTNSPIAGATNNVLILPNVTLAGAGDYRVVVTNACNVVTNVGSLAVNPGLTVTPLTNLVRYVGTFASFSTTASAGSGATNFTWRKDGVLLPGQTNRSLMLSNLTIGQSGIYTVTASRTNGCSASADATLLVAYCFNSLDVMVVIDRSESMLGTPYTDARTAATNFVRNLVLGTNADLAGLVSFSRTSSLNHVLSTNGATLEAAISALPPALGGTCISCGLTNAQAELVSARHRVGALPVMVLLTDGIPKTNDGDSVSFALFNAQQAKLAGTRIFTLGLNDSSGTNVDQVLMANLASSTNDFFYANDSSQLTAIFDQISAILCRGPNSIEGPSPSNAVVCAGQTVQFDVTATGCAIFTFEWRHEGVLLAGQTNPSLVLPNVTEAHSGEYSVIISSFCGTITNRASLTVHPNLLVLGPMSQTVCAGANVNFNANASGAGLTYQWRHNLALLPGQTNAILSLTNVSAADAGNYMVAVSGLCGGTASSAAALTVRTPPVPIPMGDVFACPGQPVSLQTATNGTGPLNIVWRRDGIVISGANSPALNLGVADSSTAGTYAVEVSGPCGSATNAALVVVFTNTVATPLVNQARCAGEAAEFNTTTDGTGPFTFVWRHDGNILAGATNASLLLPVVTTNDAGSYTVEVTGACGTVVRGAWLTVRALTTATPLTDAEVCAGRAAQFSTVASGTGPFTYVWRQDGALIDGATNASLNLLALSTTNAGLYTVEVFGACNAVTNSAVLLVREITTASALTNAVRCAGESVTIETTVGGTGPFVIVWRRDGVGLPGETGVALVLNSLTTNDAGVYSVEVTGACGAVTNSAFLNVRALITATPLADAAVCERENISFTTVASGAGPFTFVWRRHGGIVGGATNSTLTITNAGVADAGSYSVEVTGACNAVTNSATLVVRLATSTTPPEDVVSCAGEGIAVGSFVSGSGPFTIVWRRDGVLLPGVTNEILSLEQLTTNDTAVYSMEVTGACGSVTNSFALLVQARTTVAPLADVVVCPGGAAALLTQVAGTGPFGFQWRHEGVLLAGATNATLSLTNVTSAHAGLYSVMVIGECGMITRTARVDLLVLTAATPLSNAVRCVGESVAFSTMVSGSGPWQFVWRRNGDELPGETNSSLALASVTTNDAGLYSVEISGACNTVTNTATLAVNQLTTVSPLSDATVCAGESILLSVQVQGTGPHSYFWRRDGQLIITTPALIIGSATTADSGVYSVEVIGACNRVTNSATITVRALTTVAPLTNAVRCAGESMTFDAVTAGTGPFTYHWRKDGLALSGETNSVLLRNNLTTNDAGLYSVQVTGACNGVTRSATLVVNEPVVATPLADASRCVGESVTFNTAISGTGPIKIQWRRNGAALAGETNSTLAFVVISTNDAGLYSVEVVGACGAVTNGATLLVTAPLTLNPIPDQIVCAGGDLVLASGVNGGGPLTFLWRRDGAPLPTATNDTLLLTNLSLADAGVYRVEVTTPCGMLTNTMSLTVVAPPVALINQARCVGESVVFHATASTNAPFTFAWRRDGVLLADETNSTLVLTSLTTSAGGVYAVEVSGACGRVTNSAALTMLLPPSIATLANQAQCAGANVAFSAVVSGSGPFRFAWRKNGVLVSGATNSSLSLASVTPADTALYAVEVTGVCAAATNAATLTVSTMPVIAALTNLPVCIGQDALLAPVIGGVGGFTKLWRKDGVPLSGETNATLFFGAVSNATAGIYTLEVSGACGRATNHTSVTPRTNAVVAALADRTVCAGGAVTFQANVTGTGPFTFGWKKNGAVLSNETSSVLALTNLFPTDGALYTVEVTTFCNTASASALLTVESSLTATPLTNLTACAGQTVSFRTTAAGGPSFTYQWRKDGGALTNQTNATLVLAGLHATNAGLYSVEVTGCGRATNFAQLTVTPLLAATLPSVITACSCDDLTIAPNILVPGNYTYLWRKNGALLEGETNAGLYLPMLNMHSPGLYSVDISGPCNSLTLQTALEVISVNTGRWTNSGSTITIRDFDVAAPYPSTNLVRCAPKTISQLRVTLFGLSHGFPDDIDIALVAPNGQGIKLMSDNGGSGGNALNNVTLVFDDAAPGFLSNNGFIPSGTYRPTDFNEGPSLPDNFPAPGPPPGFVFATNFAQFYGANPNGAWKLFVVDDHGGQQGSLQRWVLDFGRNEFVFPNLRLTTPVQLPGGELQMELQGEPGKIYFLEASTNLVNWTIIQTNQLNAASMTLTDFTAPQFNYRFYRASGCRENP